MSEEAKREIAVAAGERAYAAAMELEADIIHDHTDHVCADALPGPVIRTIHIAFAGVIHNPIDVVSTPFYPASEKQDFAHFVGRCHRDKGPAEAIRVARMAGIPLKMAMRVSEHERPYCETDIVPLLRASHGRVEFEGEVGGCQLADHFGRARALVFSSVWEEPFGVTMVEALAHGTPVIALRRGPAPEVIIDGVTGILCDDFKEMAERLPEAMQLDPEACRADALARFDRGKVAVQHVALYERLAATWPFQHTSQRSRVQVIA